jgi:chromosomal replication initiator protein
VSPDPPHDDPASIWERVRGDLRASLPASSFELWIEPVRAVSVQGSTLYLSAPATARQWVERRYHGALEAALAAGTSALDRVAFVDEAITGRAPESPLEAETTMPPIVSPPVDSGYTFERFVIGSSNRLAHAAALAVAELPGEAYNPLFLHGPPGLGKTHLLGAIVAYLRFRRPELTVHYTTAERFTTEFVGALRKDGPDRFKQRYRKLDALLIDDVQALEGKEHTQEEFVHTFNALHASGKQIVLSSDRPPEALARLAERLRDRFEWGLCVGLGSPDLRTRTALLWQMTVEGRLDLQDPAALREIAGRVIGNVRRLQGAMTRVAAFSSMLSEPLTPGLARRALQPSSASPSAAAGPATTPDAPSVDSIQEAVCSILGVTRKELLSPSRTARVAHARQVSMYLARDLTPLSLAQIARRFDRDHTTVLHATRAVSGRLDTASDTARVVHRARELLAPSQSGATTQRPFIHHRQRNPHRPSTEPSGVTAP